ncbi:MAG: metabolite traffic protein EboE [Planctomycetes bacterium]|nr:metabolite traffic protein EboE [Planctomycetota bacterium]
MASFDLTYCGNVHPTPDLAALLASLQQHSAPVARAAARAGRRFGLGAWWPMPLAQELAASPAALAPLAAALHAAELPLWTLNVFPFGDFHGDIVKTAVYEPDWADEQRLAYTRLCAGHAARLVPPGSVVPLSTLPLGYRAPGAPPPDLRRMARNLARCASAFAAIADATGVICVLAIEPEPCCLLETAAATATFLERWLFDEGAWTTVPEAVLRRHLGVCVDLCHLAVVGEAPIAALDDLHARGIQVAKIQVSSCLEVREPAGLDRLLTFAEPRYLHQTVAADGTRALDLDEVRRRRGEFANAGRVRSHYHVPLFWDEPGPFGSTQAEVRGVLRHLAASTRPLPLLEVETYTWQVLGGGALGDLVGSAPLADRITHELQWVAEQMKC